MKKTTHQTKRAAGTKRAIPARRVSRSRPSVRAVATTKAKAKGKVAATVPPAPSTPVERHAYDGNTAFHLYLNEIAQTPLITPQEEIVLARRIKRGDKAAREHMIKANLRLVVKIARDYETYGLPLLDLINEGNMGLMKAVERFDPKKGAKLSTYAAWWIKQSIKRALANQTKTIRLPVHVVDKLFHLRKVEVRLHDLLGREPTDEELGEELGYSARRVSQLRTASIRPTSLDAPLGNDDDSALISEVIADEKAETPYAMLEDKTKSQMIRDLVSHLDPREATILTRRFGLGGNDEETLEEVGEDFGVTRERIRQIQEQALRKLRRRIERLEAVSVAE